MKFYPPLRFRKSPGGVDFIAIPGSVVTVKGGVVSGWTDGGVDGCTGRDGCAGCCGVAWG